MHLQIDDVLVKSHVAEQRSQGSNQDKLHTILGRQAEVAAFFQRNNQDKHSVYLVTLENCGNFSLTSEQLTRDRTWPDRSATHFID